MEWARNEDPKIVMLAVDSLHNGSTNGKRPQSVDELMELLSDLAWGTKASGRKGCTIGESLGRTDPCD